MNRKDAKEIWSKLFPKFCIGDRVRVAFPDHRAEYFYGTILQITPLSDKGFAIFIDFEKYGRQIPVHSSKVTVIRRHRLVRREDEKDGIQKDI